MISVSIRARISSCASTLRRAESTARTEAPFLRPTLLAATLALLAGILTQTGCTSTVSNLATLSCSSSSFLGSGSALCSFQLPAAAPAGGSVVALSSDNSSVTLPSSVTISQKQTSAQFKIAVNPVSTAKTVRIKAASGTASSTVSLTLNAAVSTLSANSSNINFGGLSPNLIANQSLVLTSTGTVPVTVVSLWFGSSTFTADPVQLPLTLKPGQTATLNLQFLPSKAQTYSSTLTIRSNSSTGATMLVGLNGYGLAPTDFADITLASTPGRAVSPTFMGFSHEWGTAQTMMGSSDQGVDAIYRQLVNNLLAYGSGPLFLRIGGDSTDTTEEPTPQTVEPFVEVANALNVRFSLGVNLGSGNVGLAVDQATQYLSQMPAGSVTALEIGNEPDMYSNNGLRPSTYRYPNYLADFNLWKSSILPAVPAGTMLMGPSWASPASLVNAAAFDQAEASHMAVISQHYYVANGQATNASDVLLAPASATAGATTVASAVATAHASGFAFRMGEMNSLFDGGEAGISNTFEAALWSIDDMFQYASVGVDGVNWHFGTNAIYAPFAIKVHTTSSGTTYAMGTVYPLYYGLLFFQMMTGHHAALLPLRLSTDANVTAWATTNASGTTQLAIINKDEMATGIASVSANGYTHAQIYRLLAPNYLSITGVTFAGQTFDGSNDGTIQGTQAPEEVEAIGGLFQIPMPVTSAALLVFSR